MKRVVLLITIALALLLLSNTLVLAQEPDATTSGTSIYMPILEREAHQENSFVFFWDINHDGRRGFFERIVPGDEREFVVENTTGISELGSFSKTGYGFHTVDCQRYGCAIQGKASYSGVTGSCYKSAPTAITSEYIQIPLYFSISCNLELPTKGATQ